MSHLKQLHLELQQLQAELQESIVRERQAQNEAVARLTQGLCRDLVDVLKRQFPGRKFKVTIESLRENSNG